MQRESNERTQTQAKFESRCEALSGIIVQVTSITQYLLANYDQRAITKQVADRFEKLAFELDKTSLNIQFAVAGDEKVALIESFRKAVEEEYPHNPLRDLDQMPADNGNVVKYLDEIERRAFGLIQDAYSYVHAHPKASAEKLSASLCNLSYVFKNNVDDLLDLLDSPHHPDW